MLLVAALAEAVGHAHDLDQNLALSRHLFESHCSSCARVLEVEPG
jgi:hypothetical protein